MILLYCSIHNKTNLYTILPSVLIDPCLDHGVITTFPLSYSIFLQSTSKTHTEYAIKFILRWPIQYEVAPKMVIDCQWARLG